VKIGDAFATISRKASAAAGSWQATILAIAAVLIWAATGPMFGYSDSWQLYANTGTTLATFIMVFLIQAEQNRSTRALQLKLSEIIRVLEKADDRLIDIEDATDERIDSAREEVCANKANTETDIAP
jgi:low affinity Fe/Cu permease